MALISLIGCAMLSKLKMKSRSIFIVLSLAMAATGCSLFHKSPPAPKPAVTPTPPPIVTADTSLQAKVISVNGVGHFVVLGFPNNALPKVNQTLFLYRAGLKVAQVKITGPQQENDIVADIVTGDAQVGDAVREQ